MTTAVGYNPTLGNAASAYGLTTPQAATSGVLRDERPRLRMLVLRLDGIVR